MAVNVTDAIGAFNRAARLVDMAAGGEAAAQEPAKPGAFAEMVRAVAAEAVDAGKRAEAVTAEAVAGNAELTEVVQAVTNAEITLQTVVAVRDRVLSAYQEIMRMPI